MLHSFVRSDINWGLLENLANKHGLYPLLYRNLKSHCREMVSEQVMQRLLWAYRMNVAKTLLFTGELLKILDALAMGKAVVSTSIGCEGIRVTNGKDIVISDTPQGFANSVLDLLQNSNKRNQLEKKGRELVVKEYSWSKIALQMNDAYVKSKSRKGIK